MALEDIEEVILRRFVYLALAGMFVWHFVVMLVEGIFSEV
jgi:hypothetical protein